MVIDTRDTRWSRKIRKLHIVKNFNMNFRNFKFQISQRVILSWRIYGIQTYQDFLTSSAKFQQVLWDYNVFLLDFANPKKCKFNYFWGQIKFYKFFAQCDHRRRSRNLRVAVFEEVNSLQRCFLKGRRKIVMFCVLYHFHLKCNEIKSVKK